MKTLVQLLIVALVVHGCARAGLAAWRYYQFKDAITQEARYGAKLNVQELRLRILQLAQEQGIPITYDDIYVERQGEQTSVWASFVEPIPLVPRLYTREQQFDIEVSVRVVRPLTADDLIK